MIHRIITQQHTENHYLRSIRKYQMIQSPLSLVCFDLLPQLDFKLIHREKLAA